MHILTSSSVIFFFSFVIRSDRERTILQGKLRAAGKNAELAAAPTEKKGDKRQEKVRYYLNLFNN